jgi:hypothetical protein
MQVIHVPGIKRRHSAVTRRAEAMVAEVAAGRVELLIGVCRVCGQFYAADDVGQPCSVSDRHDVDYYVLVGIRRPEGVS